MGLIRSGGFIVVAQGGRVLSMHLTERGAKQALTRRKGTGARIAEVFFNSSLPGPGWEESQ